MALSAATLKSEIEGDLIALYTTAESAPMSKEVFAAEMADLISTRIVDHIVGNLEVTITAAQTIAVLPAAPPYTTALLDGSALPVTGTITTPSVGAELQGTAE